MSTTVLVKIELSTIRLSSTFPSDDNTFYYYAVDGRGGRDVELTTDERDAWTEAGRQYCADVDYAWRMLRLVADYSTVVPGAQRLAWYRYHRRTRKATARYRPYSEAIRARLAQPRTAAETTKEKQERDARQTYRVRQWDTADRAVWRWSLPRDSSTIWVFRDDVALAEHPPEGGRNSTKSLTARDLEKALLRSRARFIRWEAASMHATVEEASTSRYRGSFADWWRSATTKTWRSITDIPGGVGARAGTSSGGGHGIGSSDYGGGHYGGDSGGGHTSGGFGSSF